MGLPLLVSIQFQVLFHCAIRASFHLSLAVLVHYRSLLVFSLAEWSPRIPAGFFVPCGTQVRLGPTLLLSTGLSPSLAAYSKAFD